LHVNSEQTVASVWSFWPNWLCQGNDQGVMKCTLFVLCLSFGRPRKSSASNSSTLTAWSSLTLVVLLRVCWPH